MSLYLAIDPGGTTGIAMRLNDTYETIVCDEAIQLWSIVTGTPWDAVVYEDFKAQQISKYGIYTVQLIGAIRALCWVNGVSCYTHEPQQRKPYLPKARAWLSVQHRAWQGHEMDALAHLMMFEEKGH